MANIVEELVQALGSEAVISGPAVSSRACSYWDSSPLQALAIIRPDSTQGVSRALAICYEHGQTVVTHAGLTGCVAGAVTRAADIVLSLERLNKIEEIDAVGRTATVQAGVVLQTLQETVAEQDLYFPLDLGARGSCTIGGNASTNAGGINVIRYGMARALILGLEAVLADGTILSSMNRMLKNNAGYDLKQLFIGSEGTLGIITRLVVRLEEAPVSREAAMVAMEEFEQVQSLLKHLQRNLGGSLSAYEVMWGDHYRAVTEADWHRPPLDRGHAYYVMLEAEGADPERDRERFMATMESAMEAGLVADAIIPQSETERRALWAVREEFDAVLEPKPVFLYDVSLPIRDMPTYVAAVQSRLRARWPDSDCFVLGHVGDGNLHFFIRPNADTGPDMHEQSDSDVYEPLIPIGGSISAEHGIGTEKRSRLPISRSETEIGLMRALKVALDPKGILNPGVVIEID